MTDYSSKLDDIRTKLKVDFVAIAFPEDLFSGDAISWNFVSGNLNNKFKRIHLRRGKGIAGQVLKTGRPCIEQDVLNSTLYKETFRFPIIAFEKLTSFIALPLWKYNKAVGVILIGNRNQIYLPTSLVDDLELYIRTDLTPFYEKDVFNVEKQPN